MMRFSWDVVRARMILRTWCWDPLRPKCRYGRYSGWEKSSAREHRRPLSYDEVLFWKQQFRHGATEEYYRVFPEELN